jgi:hypothetical protein
MKNLIKFFFVVFASTAMLLSCSKPNQKDPQQNTPLVLTIDKSTIINDGVDAVTFTVKQDGEDVTLKTLICSTSDGGSCLLGHTFSSKTPGQYTYYAYFAEDMEIKSNTVDVEVIDPSEIEEMVFIGTTTVDDTFSLDNIRFELTPNEEGTLDLMMYEIKFAEQMPMTLDIEVPGIDYTGQSGTLSLSATTIVPLVGGTPMEERTITDLTGSVEGEKLVLGFNVGTNHVDYQGDLIAE